MSKSEEQFINNGITDDCELGNFFLISEWRESGDPFPVIPKVRVVFRWSRLEAGKIKIGTKINFQGSYVGEVVGVDGVWVTAEVDASFSSLIMYAGSSNTAFVSHGDGINAQVNLGVRI